MVPGMSTPFWRLLLCVTESLDTSTEESDHGSNDGLAVRRRSLDIRELWRDPPEPWRRREAGHCVLIVLARGRTASDVLGASRRARTPRTCCTRRTCRL